MCHCALIFLKKDLCLLSLACLVILESWLFLSLPVCHFGSRGGSGGSGSGGNRASDSCPRGLGWLWAGGRGLGSRGLGWPWAGRPWAALFWVKCASVPAQSLEATHRRPADSRSRPTSVSSSCESQVKGSQALWPGPCVGDREGWALIRGLGRVPSVCRLPQHGHSSAPHRHGTEMASWLSSLCPFKPAMVGRVLLTTQRL